jgi:hypothetical protein
MRDIMVFGAAQIAASSAGLVSVGARVRRGV